MHMRGARSTIIIYEPHFAKPIQKETDSRAGSAYHVLFRYGECGLFQGGSRARQTNGLACEIVDSQGIYCFVINRRTNTLRGTMLPMQTTLRTNEKSSLLIPFQ